MEKCPVCGQEVEVMGKEGSTRWYKAAVKALKGEKGCWMCGGVLFKRKKPNGV